jgi:1,6-anhydro-N-acetylmuramate kinase
VNLYIGLMSGTSLDGVDGVLIDLTPGQAPRLRGHRHEPFVAALRSELMALNTPGDDELDRAACAAGGVALAYSSVVGALLFDCGVSASEVKAIGAHGQTVRHRPDAGYTVQLLDGSLLAELTRIDVVCDFRSRDVAAGGQGAPLAPGFHAAVFGHTSQARAVLNLGGIANLTLLVPGRPVLGFDTGPASALLDAWCERHQARAFDEDGAWAASGTPLPALLEALQQEPFFALAPPKSTGRDLFHSGREAGPAAAGGGGVRVLDDELGALQVFLVVDLGAHQVLQAHRVDQQGDAVLLHLRVVVVDDLVEGEAVLEPGAAAALHEHAQLQVGVAFLIDEIGHLGGRTVGEHQRERKGIGGSGQRFGEGIHDWFPALVLRGGSLPRASGPGAPRSA